MSKWGPIIWLEDDPEDQHIIEEALKEIKQPRPLYMFSTAEELLNYLRSTTDQPFVILCDVNLPGTNGLQLRNQICKDESLRKKSIPFIFFSTTADERDVTKAYDMIVQGYFEKGNSFPEMKARLIRIFEYWSDCKHPNSFDNTTNASRRHSVKGNGK